MQRGSPVGEEGGIIYPVLSCDGPRRSHAGQHRKSAFVLDRRDDVQTTHAIEVQGSSAVVRRRRTLRVWRISGCTPRLLQVTKEGAAIYSLI